MSNLREVLNGYKVGELKELAKVSAKIDPSGG